MKPVRRNFAHLDQVERDQFVNALQALDATKVFPDGVSYWDKQDQIHQATHVHGGPAFVPWHRELGNRLEAMLREVDLGVALHYWDWTTDPTSAPDGRGGTVNLFTAQNMGSAAGRAGVPFDAFDNAGIFAGSRDETRAPADPPQEITRTVTAGAPTQVDTDAALIACADALPQAQQWTRFREVIEGTRKADGSFAPFSDWNHNALHGYIGGTIATAHSSFEDPFVFLLHSNLDRLWAMWQTQPGFDWRLDPDQVYGNEDGDPDITDPLEPWAGGAGTRPWVPPAKEVEVKNCKHHSVVAPPNYDTLLVPST